MIDEIAIEIGKISVNKLVKRSLKYLDKSSKRVMYLPPLISL